MFLWGALLSGELVVWYQCGEELVVYGVDLLLIEL